MSKRATHQGTCQICGRLQMLPGGVLSNHGYEVAQFGFFNGICGGAKHKPFEEDKAQAVASATMTAAFAADHRKKAAALRADESTKGVWIDHYKGCGSRWESKSYERICVDLFDADDKHGHVRPHYVAPEKKNILTGEITPPSVHELTTRYGFYSDAKDAAKKIRERAALGHEATATQMENYVAWQRKRCAEWKPMPLTERSKIS